MILPSFKVEEGGQPLGRSDLMPPVAALGRVVGELKYPKPQVEDARGTHGLSTVTMTELEQMGRFKKEVIVKRYVSHRFTNKRCSLNTLEWLSMLWGGGRKCGECG